MQNFTAASLFSLSSAIVLSLTSLSYAQGPSPSPMSHPMGGTMTGPMAAPSPASAPPHKTPPDAKLSANLLPSTEVPPTTAKGSGTANFSVYMPAGKVCYNLKLTSDVGTATAAHIHAAKAGKNGPPVIPLNTPGAKGIAVGCAKVSATLIQDLAKNPANYYVNVHTKQYPNGAIRGQLAAATAMMKP